MILQLQRQTGGSVRQICQALGLPRSSFHRAARPSPRSSADAQMGRLVEEIFKRHRRRYGYRRIGRELADRATVCAPCRLRRLMRQRGLRAIQPKHYLPKTSDGRADRPSANLLALEPLPKGPDEAWAGDITFIPTSAGWLYLALIIDLGSRRIVGWSLANHMRAELVVHALQQALAARPQARGALFHSDRGSQYGSRAFRSVLKRGGLRQSMSARANPYDNAWTESFIGTLKREMLQGGCFTDATDARLELFEYIEGYYNTHRKHSALGYLSPNQFETQILTNTPTSN
jgi:transposase InsO family protein